LFVFVLHSYVLNRDTFENLS